MVTEVEPQIEEEPQPEVKPEPEAEPENKDAGIEIIRGNDIITEVKEELPKFHTLLNYLNS